MRTLPWSLAAYRALLEAAIGAGFVVCGVSDAIEAGASCDVDRLVVRHDVDRKIGRALKMARLEHELGVASTYYFRLPRTFNKPAIRTIAALGHEIGYHYEDLARHNGDVVTAVTSFRANLELLRDIAPVKTVCMHGRPLSRIDSRKMWDHVQFERFGLIGEPFLSFNAPHVLYLTDSGDSWTNSRANVRDRMSSSAAIEFESTHEIATALSRGRVTGFVHLNVHPERWSETSSAHCFDRMKYGTKNVMKELWSRFR